MFSVSRHIRIRIDTLMESIGGVRPAIDPSILRRLFEEDDFPAMLGWIKHSMNLDIKVGLRIVDQNFVSAPMWIETPSPMPAYGSYEFRRSRVIVNATQVVLRSKPFDWIVAGFAHELSHVILKSLNCKLQDDEKAVDLAAMIIGYRTFIADAQLSKTEGNMLVSLISTLLILPFGIFSFQGPSRRISRMGYLTESEAADALWYIRQIEKKEKSAGTKQEVAARQ